MKNIACVFAALACLVLVSTATAQEKRLLLDKRVVEKVENAALRLGTVEKHPANPLFGEEFDWEPRYDNMYPNVLYDEEEKIYKVWYFTWILDEATSDIPREKRKPGKYMEELKKAHKRVGRGRREGLGYATSKDGIHWTKPMMELVKWDGNPSNLIDRHCHGAGILKDMRERDPARRYKMLIKGQGICGRFSPDGLHWGRWISFPEIDAAGDTHNNALWSPELNKYVCFTRLWRDCGRVVGRSESPDFIHWTKAVKVLGNNIDHQAYSMPVIRYAGVYLGMADIIDVKADRMHTELAWSPDTINWHRIEPGKPFIANSEKEGEYDWGIVHAGYPIIRDNEIRIYYGGCNAKHFDWRDGFLCLATLRPDGFAGYEPLETDRPAVVLSTPMMLGEKLKLSADAKGGSVTVSVVDEQGAVMLKSEPITENVTVRTVTWQKGGSLKDLAGEKARLRFEIERAKLYSFEM